MTAVLASLADERCGYHLLNLISSVKTGPDIFGRIVVYDLRLNSARSTGLSAGTASPALRSRLGAVRHVKPWIWTRTEATDLSWLAGGTVVRRLAEPMPSFASRAASSSRRAGGTVRSSRLRPRTYLDKLRRVAGRGA